MDYSQPGSSVHGIFQARVLEWGAILLIPTHIHTEACIDHYFLTKYRVLVLAFINNVHELNNKKKHNSRITYKYLLNISLSIVPSRRRQWHPTPVLLTGKSHGWRSLEGCSPWGRWGSDTTERLHFHFSLSCIGEGKGNPLQCSCLENPRDGGAWWAAVYGVAQSRTRLKWLSSRWNTICYQQFFWPFRLSAPVSWMRLCLSGLWGMRSLFAPLVISQT